MNKIGFKNIGVFKTYQEIELRPITILTGANNSGKSTFTKFLKLLQQGFKNYNKDKDVDLFDLRFPESLKKDIGSFKSIINRQSKDNSILISKSNSKIKYYLRYKGIEEKNLFSNLFYEYNKDVEALLNEIIITDNENNEILHLKTIPYFEYKKYNEIKPDRLIYNSPDAEDDFVWDCDLNKKNSDNFRKYIINFKNVENESLEKLDSEEKKKYTNNIKYDKLNKYKDFLFPSLLSGVVLSDKDFFNKKEFKNDYYSTTRKKLKSLKINTFNDFKRKYIDLDEKIFFEIYKKAFKHLFLIYYEDQLKREIFDVFHLNHILNGTPSINLKNIDEKSLLNNIDNPLVPLLLEEIKNKDLLEQLINKTPYAQKIDFVKAIGDAINLNLKSIKEYIDSSISSKLSYYNQNNNVNNIYLKKDNTIKKNPFYKYAKMASDKKIDNKAINFINKWIKKLNVGDKFVIKDIKVNHETIGYAFFIKKNNELYSLTETGLGVRKLLEILCKVSTEKVKDLKEIQKKITFRHFVPDNNTIVLEEPESNLHPCFQSILAEIIVDAAWFYSTKYIIETHSEYFIRKLQCLTAKKAIKPNESIIYYFNNPDKIPKGEKQIKKITIREDGMMDEDFGEGFFDESTRLTIDLLKLQNQN